MPARTVPRTAGSASVNGAKATDAAALAAALAETLSICRPSSSSVTGTLAARSAPWLLTPAFTVIRSCPENDARPKFGLTETERFAALSDATDTGVRRMLSPKWTSSEVLQPTR